MVIRENLYYDNVTDMNQIVKNYNTRFQWDHINKEYFDQELYFRDIRPEEYALYFLPNILKAKKLLGKTQSFLNTVRDILVDVIIFNTGNSEDLSHALLLLPCVSSRVLTEEQKQLIVYHHFLFM